MVRQRNPGGAAPDGDSLRLGRSVFADVGEGSYRYPISPQPQGETGFADDHCERRVGQGDEEDRPDQIIGHVYHQAGIDNPVPAHCQSTRFDTRRRGEADSDPQHFSDANLDDGLHHGGDTPDEQSDNRSPRHHDDHRPEAGASGHPELRLPAVAPHHFGRHNGGCDQR
jgi:hypothetical protein